ncbi:uncharacterized protein LOC134690195 [Mytilus trossulus]|uniref:uncharacterized protein LOC134690195 n=1 Tax=Mytilus trossulus TaxID=6551 RepID=UPI00300766DD
MLVGDFNSRTASDIDFSNIVNSKHDIVSDSDLCYDYSNVLQELNMLSIRKNYNDFGPLLIASGSCSPENFRVTVKVDGKPVNEDLVLDLEKKTFLVNVGEVNHLGPNWSKTINLHDFNVKRLALKKVDDGICYVTLMTENLTEISARLHNMTSQIFATNLTKHVYQLSNTNMSNENLLAYAGPKITNFCHGYKSIYAHRLEHDMNLRRRFAPAEAAKAPTVLCSCSEHIMYEGNNQDK